MAKLVKQWNEGDGNIVATYEGSGDGPISLTTDIPNEGIDREQEITIQTTDKNKSVNVLVKQEGLREVFATTDGFILADGGTFNVLKVGGDTPDVPEPTETYTRLSYLESTGSQYINTGYVVQEDDIIEMQYTKLVRTTVEEYMFGASDDNGRVWAYISSNSIYPRFGGDSKSAFSSTRWKNVMTLQKGSVDFDGTASEIGYVSLPQVPLYIFARNNNGTAAGFATIKSAGCTITKASGELALKMRPCRRDSDGAIGMIDLVSGRFCENLGSEPFLYGGGAQISEDYEILDYIAFDNDKIYDTGVYGNETTEIELLFRRTDTSGADYLFGVSYGSRLTGYLTSSGYWRYGSGAPVFNTNDKLLHYAHVTPGSTLIDNATRTFTVGNAFQTSSTIPVGGYKSSATAFSRTYQGHLYYFRMWHGTEVVADLMPCKRLSDGVEGFWDCVTQSFIEPI